MSGGEVQQVIYSHVLFLWISKLRVTVCEFPGEGVHQCSRLSLIETGSLT